MKKPQFSKKEAVKFGFGIAKSNILFFIGLLIIVVFVSVLTSALRNGVQKAALAYLVFTVVQYLVNTVVAMGLIKISLEFVAKAKPEIRDIVYYKPIVKYVLASIASGIIVFVGFILLIIPGIICLVVGLFVTVPLSMLATAFVYRRLLLQSEAA